MPSDLDYADLLLALARNRDPYTGDQLDEDGPLQYPEVVRALYEAAAVLREAAPNLPARRHDPTEGGRYPRSGKRWTEEEDDELRRRWGDGETVEAIRAALERKQGGIAARLEMHGLIEDRSAVTPETRGAP